MTAQNDQDLTHYALAGFVLVLLNYALWALAMPYLLCAATVYGLFGMVAAFSLKQGKRYLPVLLVIVVLLVISVGSPSEAWDTRSIWLFHAKRMIIDGDFYATLDGYAQDFHADYPQLIPALSASVALAAGVWNELIPKSSSVLALVPALLLLVSGRTILEQLWLSAAMLLVGGVYLVNGYMDALIAVYFTALFACVLSPRTDRVWHILTFLVAASLPLIKNEGGLLLAVTIGALLYIQPKRWRFAVLLAAAFFPALFWHMACLRAGIGNDMATGTGLSHVLDNLSEPKHYLMFLWYMIGRNALVLLVPLSAYLYVRRKHGVPRLVTVVCGAYFALLTTVYFSTPHDFLWHLYTSADRTVLPLGMVLSYFAIVSWKRG